MPTTLIDRDAAHDAAQRELSKPIYPKEQFSDRLNEWISDFLYRIISKASDVPGGWFTVAVLLTLLAVAVVVAVRIARRTMRTNRKGDFSLFGAAGLTATEHRATAERFAAERNWSVAIRHRLRAIARQLEENGVLNAVPGRTANELAANAGRVFPDLRAELVDGATSFNDVTYGERPGTEAAYRDITILDNHIRSRRLATSHDADSAHHTDAWTPLQ
ncbi:MAG: DUF4129 domain-containing protein [Candidatus Sericytochromatia bacterium]